MNPGVSESAQRWGTPIALAAVLATVAWFLAPFLLDHAIVVERDSLSSILPTRAFLAHSLQAGSWPMWNPLAVLGKPFLAEWQTGLFYPPSLLLLVPPFTRGFNLFFVFHYAWTALGAFVLLRALGIQRPAAALGALVWTLGGPLVSLGHLLNHLTTISWLPWVLWAWVRSEDLRRRVVGSSLLLAAALLTGSPEMALLIAGLLVLLARDVRALWVPPLAGMLAAMQLVPVWLYLGATHRGTHGLPAASVLAYSTPPGRLSELVSALAPTPHSFLPTIYLGPIPVGLALLALVFASSRTRLLVVLVVVALVATALGSHTPLLPFLHRHVPGIDLLRYPEKLLVGLHAVIAFGAAWGLRELTLRVPRRLAPIVAVGLAALVVADLARVNRGELFTLPPAVVASPPPVARAMAQARPAPSGLVRYYANPIGTPTPADAAEATRLDRALLYAATGQLYGLADVNTPASLNLVVHERLHRALESVPRAQALRALAALGTRWITSFADLPDHVLREVPVASSPARLYALGGEPRRAFVAARIHVAHNADEALARFVRDTAGGQSEVAVVEGIGVDDLSYRAPDGRRVRWVESANDALTLEVSVDAPGLLVVNDTFLSGWRAWVDERPASIERVNGVVRGVWLTAGDHRVTMRYRTPGLPLGAALSLVALTGLLLAGYRAGQ